MNRQLKMAVDSFVCLFYVYTFMPKGKRDESGAYNAPSISCITVKFLTTYGRRWKGKATESLRNRARRTPQIFA